jgi:hypothetical protein
MIPESNQIESRANSCTQEKAPAPVPRGYVPDVSCEFKTDESDIINELLEVWRQLCERYENLKPQKSCTPLQSKKWGAILNNQGVSMDDISSVAEQYERSAYLRGEVDESQRPSFDWFVRYLPDILIGKYQDWAKKKKKQLDDDYDAVSEYQKAMKKNQDLGIFE